MLNLPKAGKFLGLLAGLFTAAALTSCGGHASSGATNGGGTPSASLSLSVSSSTLTVYPGTSFSVQVTASEYGTTATPTITIGALPAGLTTAQTFPLSIPSPGAFITFTASSGIAPGSYAVSFAGTAGSATATASLAVTVAAGTPSADNFVSLSLFNEVGLTAGGSASLAFEVIGSSYYSLSISVSGLPSGVSFTITPQIVQPYESFIVSLSASANAPAVRNLDWQVIATPAANLPALSRSLLLDITPVASAGWSNRTAYTSTRATPYGAVYDPAHQLIYSSNPTWSRIDVISDSTHAVVKTIPLRDSRGMDISPDGTKVWVATGSQVMYAIDTSTFHVTTYQLPDITPNPTYEPNTHISWEGAQVLALADGTVMLEFSNVTGSGVTYGAIWNPTTSALTLLTPPGLAQWGVLGRSGDGKVVYSAGEDEGENSFSYNVLNKTMSTAIPLSSFGYAGAISVNQDGSRIAIADFGNGFMLRDGNFNVIGQLPYDGGWGSFPAENLIPGGSTFSPDGSTLYEETGQPDIPLLLTIDVATQQITSTAPAMPVIPLGTEMSPPFYECVPFAVDSSGMVLGVDYHGIAFDDPKVNINYVSNQPGAPTNMNWLGEYGGNSGPLSGGTQIGGGGNTFSLTPDAYFGGIKAQSSLSSNAVQLISPPATASGPVDIKLLFPDGTEVYDPQIFTYGIDVQDAILSGSPPQGGVAGKLDAFGLPPQAPNDDTVTVGSNNAAVTSTGTQYPLYTGEQTAMYLSYTVPAGTPGWADLTVKAPAGTGTLPKSIFYAKSVVDYFMSDSPTFVLYDSTRNNVYLSAGDHIDVFSMTSGGFSTPLQPPALGAKKQFQGLALTPDGHYLLAADLTDGSLAAIDPDTPSDNYVVKTVTNGTEIYSGTTGPLFVAADNLSHAYVVYGGVIGVASGPGGPGSEVNLASKSSAGIAQSGSTFGAGFVQSSSDGSLVAFGGGAEGGFEVYSPALQAPIPSAGPAQAYGVAVSGDGNVLATERAFASPSGNIIGRMGYPPIFYPQSGEYYNFTPYASGSLQNPALNAAGSLYFWAYPNYIDIVDVQHGIPRLRFSLSETVTNTVSPMAIDGGGQHIFLITNMGLTIIDLGEAPLSIGHLSQTTVSVGSQITVRGSGFENQISATVGGVTATISYSDSETLTLNIPAANAGLEDIVLTNPDGTTYTLGSAVTIQ